MLQAIGGEVTSQKLNDNFSYLDTQVNILIQMKTDIRNKGASTDPEADNTQVFLNAYNSIAATGGTLYIPDGKFNAPFLNIVDSNIKVSGYGTLKNGGLIIGDPVTIKDLNFLVEGIGFEFDSIVTGKNAIELQNTHKGKIININTRNTDKAIYVRPIGAVQHTSRIRISESTFHASNFVLYTDRDDTYNSASYLGCGDFHFIDNQADEWIGDSHLYLLGMDGLVMTGNTLFFPNYATPSTTKRWNVYIDYANFININNNNLFEAGFESIVLRRACGLNVTDNNIAWPGERSPAYGIKVEVGDMNGLSLNYGGIESNKIYSPSSGGIDIRDNVGNLGISDNKIYDIGATFPYYGTTDLSTVTKFAVRTSSTSSNIQVIGNFAPNGDFSLSGTNNTQSDNFDKKGNRIRSYGLQTISTPVTTIDPNGTEQLNLNSSTTHTITSIVATFSGHEITMVAFNGNTTLQNNSTTSLKGAVNVTIPNGGLMKFRYTTGKWYEVSRNF
jgi:hypothetical protein